MSTFDIDVPAEVDTPDWDAQTENAYERHLERQRALKRFRTVDLDECDCPECRTDDAA